MDRDGDGRAGALAIRLRAPDRQHDPLGLEGEVSDFERDELAAGSAAAQPTSSSARSRSPRRSSGTARTTSWSVGVG
jgi:hypothetical protein